MQYMGFGYYPNPTIVVYLNGAVGVGTHTLSYSFEIEEGRLFNSGTGRLDYYPMQVSGCCSELVITKILWDIMDNVDTNDFSKDRDDDNLALAPEDVWRTFRYLADPFYANENITMEDFWDSWFSLGNNYQTEMEWIFKIYGIDYYEDSFENDDSWSSANQINLGQLSQEHTIYPRDDEDWFVINTVNRKEYYIETKDLRNGADTYIEVFDRNNNMVKFNDNVGSSLCSYVKIVPEYEGQYYIKICSSPTPIGFSRYGSYKLSIEDGPAGSSDFVDDGILTVSAPGNGGEFTSFKRAIRKMKNGDTILFIDSSIFNERVEINGFQNITIKCAEGVHPVISGIGISLPLITIENCSNISIEGLTIEGSSSAGIYIGSFPDEIKISDCIIKNNPTGIKINPYNRYSLTPEFHSRILNNEIYYNISAGIMIYSGKHLISGNKIYSSNNFGVGLLYFSNSFSSSDRQNKVNLLHIYNNYVYENGTGIRIDVSGNTFAKVINNLIAFNCRMGIRLDSYCAYTKYLDLQLINNTICRNSAGINNYVGNRCQIRLKAYNCILTDSGYNGAIILPSFEYSVFSESASGYVDLSKNNIIANPQFLSLASTYAGSNFHLTENSPCIDIGADIIYNPRTEEAEQLPLKDIEERSRTLDGDLNGLALPDIGAYEFNHPPRIFIESGSFEVEENEELRFSVNAVASDGGDLIYSVSGLPEGSRFNSMTKEFSWVPDFTQAGIYNVNFTVSGGELSDTKTISIKVVDDRPNLVITKIGTYKIPAGLGNPKSGLGIGITLKNTGVILTILNNGNRDLRADEDFNIGYGYDSRSGRYMLRKYINHNGIQKGVSITVDIIMLQDLPLRFKVDLNNGIEETSERDNEFRN